MNALSKKISSIINSKINLIPDDYKEYVLDFLNIFTNEQPEYFYVIIDQTLSFLMDVLNLEDKLRPQFVIKVIENNINFMKNQQDVFFSIKTSEYLIELFKKHHIDTKEIAQIIKECYYNKNELLAKKNLNPVYQSILKMIEEQQKKKDEQQEKYISIMGALENLNKENIEKICLFLKKQNLNIKDVDLVENYLQYKLNKLEEKKRHQIQNITFQSSDDKPVIFSEKEFRQKLLNQKTFLENVKNGRKISANEYLDYIFLARILDKTDDEIELECRDLFPHLKVDETAYPLLDERSAYLKTMELDLIPILENIKEIKKTSDNSLDQTVWNELLQEFYEELYLKTSNNFKYERNLKEKR